MGRMALPTSLGPWSKRPLLRSSRRLMAKHLLHLRKRRARLQRSPMAGTSRSIRRWLGPLYSVAASLFPANPVHPEAHLVLSTAYTLQVRVSKRVNGLPTLCLCGQLFPLNAKTHWSTSTSIWFWVTRWQAARFFPTFILRVESGGWPWTFMPPSGHQARAAPPDIGILSLVSLTVDSLAKSGGF